MDSLRNSKDGVMYPSVTVNGQELKRVNQYMYLGVFLDTCPDWNHHIGVTASNMYVKPKS